MTSSFPASMRTSTMRITPTSRDIVSFINASMYRHAFYRLLALQRHKHVVKRAEDIHHIKHQTVMHNSAPDKHAHCHHAGASGKYGLVSCIVMLPEQNTIRHFQQTLQRLIIMLEDCPLTTQAHSAQHLEVILTEEPAISKRS